MPRPDEPESKRVPPGCVFVSGGASGADEAWTHAALALSIPVTIFSFVTHYLPNTYLGAGGAAPLPGLEVVQVPSTDLFACRPELKEAAKILHRVLTKTDGYNYFLLARNVMLARNAVAMYVVGRFTSSRKHVTRSVSVDGGTGWACQLYVNRQPVDPPRDIPLYFFNDVQSDQTWYVGHVSADCFTWRSAGTPPHPTTYRSCAAIGSRDISPIGQQAIRTLMASCSPRQ